MKKIGIVLLLSWGLLAGCSTDLPDHLWGVWTIDKAHMMVESPSGSFIGPSSNYESIGIIYFRPNGDGAVEKYEGNLTFQLYPQGVTNFKWRQISEEVIVIDSASWNIISNKVSTMELATLEVGEESNTRITLTLKRKYR